MCSRWFVACVAVLFVVLGVCCPRPSAGAPGVDVSGVPACVNEDGSTSGGYQPLCYWDGGDNGAGASYVLERGRVVSRR